MWWLETIRALKHCLDCWRIFFTTWVDVATSQYQLQPVHSGVLGVTIVSPSPSRPTTTTTPSTLSTFLDDRSFLDTSLHVYAPNSVLIQAFSICFRRCTRRGGFDFCDFAARCFSRWEWRGDCTIMWIRYTITGVCLFFFLWTIHHRRFHGIARRR